MSIDQNTVSDGARIDSLLLEHFGFSEFHPGQREPIETVLNGEDAVVVMPTGSGKSICFQLAAMALDGITLVVSPLISLMKDQVDRLTERGLPATSLNSSLTGEETADRVSALRQGKTRLVYVAPERFRNHGFRALLGELNVSLLAIDEAHCISQWGHDFRPDYLRLGELVKTLPKARVMALTATATPEVRDDIARQLGLGHGERPAPRVFVRGFRRDNLRLTVGRVSTHDQKLKRILKILEGFPTGIVYCSTRKQVERVGVMLAEEKVKHLIYHAGLTDEQRARSQEDFMSGKVPVVVATNAFGMGVDRSDLRFVIHWDIPGSIEAYYQEVGRAGRDGVTAHCELLYNYADVRTQEFFLDGSNPDPVTIMSVWSEVRKLLKDGPQTSSLEDWGAHISSTRNKISVNTCMGLYERCGLVSREIEAGQRCYTTMLVENASLDRLKEMLPALEEKRRRDMRKLDLMLGYVNARQCRHRFILDYFGEPGAARQSCARCDNCGIAPSSPERPPSEDEWVIIQKLLSCVGRLDGRLDRNGIIAMATGSVAAAVLAQGLEKVPTYGALAGFPPVYLRRLFDELVRVGAITLGTEPDLVAGLSTRGKAVVWRKETVSLRWPKRVGEPSGPDVATPSPRRQKKKGSKLPDAEPEVALTAEGEAFFEVLKDWRKGEAGVRRVPAFVVLGDRTLKAIASGRPSTEAELKRIVGIGPAKFTEYGRAILELVARVSS